MNITALIPARSGSKRIPDKNVKDLNGIPLVAHSIISAVALKDHGIIDRVVVTSNDGRVLTLEYNAEYLMRPNHLCEDDVTDQPVILHAVQALNLTGLIVYLRPTTPYRTLYHVEEAIKLIKKIGFDATGLRSIEKMSESAFKCFTFNGARIKPAIDCLREGGNSLRYVEIDYTDAPDQLCPETYKPNGYVDIARVDQILQGNLWGDKVVGYRTPHTPEIDTPDDWDYASWWGKRSVEQILKFGKERLCI
jgi:CMP-N,N'-diacetyllegionaminic acid synthase